MNERRLTVGIVIVLLLTGSLITIIGPSADCSPPPSGNPTATVLATGLQGGSGSTIGPDGAIYVTEMAAGRVSRVDPETGQITTFATGLPKSIIGFGGPVDVAFRGDTAYVLVTLVDSFVGGTAIDGIYRVDGPNSFTIVADIGEFNIENPPKPTIPFEIEVPTGVQYALQTFRDGFLVTDGHLNRVLSVTLDGAISILRQFNDIVPTGLAVHGHTIYVAEAGPVPHLPQNGKVVAFSPGSPTTTVVASGASLLVDVEFSRGQSLYALSQGPGVPGAPPGSPAQPNSGSLIKANSNGTFTVVVDGLDLPTSLEFIRTTAYVVTLTGEILKIEGASGPPFGIAH